MKTTINTKCFTNAISIASNYTQKNGDDANKIVFEHLNTSTLLIKATDFVESVELKIECSDLEEFEIFSVNARDLLSLLKIAKTEELTLEEIGDYLHFKSGKSKMKIQKVAAVPLMTKDLIVENSIILTKGFMDALKGAEHSIDTSSPKPEITGALIHGKNGLMRVVSTDTKRLTVQSVGESESDFDLILPKAALKSVYKNFEENSIVNITKSEIFIENEFQRYSSKKINSKYVDYSRIIPQTYQQTIILEKKMLEEIIKDSSALDSKICVEICGGRIKASSMDNSIETEKEIETGNVDIKFFIEAKYVLDYLSASTEKVVQIGFNEDIFPVAFISSPTAFEIIMPISTKQ